MRLRIESSIAALGGLLAVITLVWHDWIEVTGWDPDRHGGALEWAIVAGLALASLAAGLAARRTALSLVR
jgi:hypothetical protein